MSLSPAERDALIRRYAEGPAKVRAAWEKVPEAARAWRPAPGKWSLTRSSAIAGTPRPTPRCGSATSRLRRSR